MNNFDIVQEVFRCRKLIHPTHSCQGAEQACSGHLAGELVFSSGVMLRRFATGLWQADRDEGCREGRRNSPRGFLMLEHTHQGLQWATQLLACEVLACLTRAEFLLL